LGFIEIIVEYKDKSQSKNHYFQNIVLNKGREALTAMLVNEPGSINTYVENMLFGDGGMDRELQKKKVVSSDRNSLFGITRAKKSVISQIDPLAPTQAIFTAVLSFEDANDITLNEMALQLNTENLFSMATFPDLGKTDQMQITFNWRISFC
jgi:hypothetical protein